jgi:exopolysaccharide biosynthesis protein
MKKQMKWHNFLKTNLILIGVMFLIFSVFSFTNSSSIQYKKYDVRNSFVHTLFIPSDSQYKISIALTDEVKSVEEFAKNSGGIAVLNAGFFDPKNQETTSYIIQDGKITADPRQNDRLMDNPDLQPYLQQILNRSEWRQYQCQEKTRYTIAFHQAPIPSGCQLVNSVGGGPRLLPDLTAETEAFITYQKGQIVRDALGFNRRNARTAIGITRTGHLIWVMVAQKTEKPDDSGMSLPELANFLRSLGVVEALNLDGGSSSSFYYQGTPIYGRIDGEGKIIKRPVKSVLVLQHN